MYCDFCGNKLSYPVRFCSKCGRQLKDHSGDTQPIPMIDDTMLSDTTKRQALGSVPWYHLTFKKKAPMVRSKSYRVMYYLVSITMIAGLIYVLTIFKTVKEYQMLLSVMGSLVAVYLWWKR